MRRKKFEIQTDRLISAGILEGVRSNKKKEPALCCPGGRQSENRKKKHKKRQVLRPYQRTIKIMKHEGDGDTNYNWCTRNDLPKLDKGTGGIRNQRAS